LRKNRFQIEIAARLPEFFRRRIMVKTLFKKDELRKPKTPSSIAKEDGEVRSFNIRPA
jgi:hypothetical protein